MRGRRVGVTATPVTSRDSSQYRLKNPGNVPGPSGTAAALFWDSGAGVPQPERGAAASITPFFVPLARFFPPFRRHSPPLPLPAR